MQRVGRAIGIAFAIALTTLTIPAASAGTAVDPDALTPPPPPGASCQQTGPGAVICHTAISFPVEGEGIFDIGCGTIYQTSTDDRLGTRWYTDGLLVRRHIRGSLAGTWSLAPDASGVVVNFVGHWFQDDHFAVPGDPDSVVETSHGLEFHGTMPGLGAELILAGTIDPDGTVHGVNRVDEPVGEISAAAIATLESVLCD